jgi:hypothetical protein
MPLPIADTLPDGEQLLRLEAGVRVVGSGLEASSLVGRWRFHRVWPRRGGAPQAAPSALLRGLDASLEIGEPDTGGALPLVNRVALGALELRFEGHGSLAGRRPLLRFWFARWQLRLAGRSLIERPLARPEERRLPFFALIGRGRADAGVDWLAARGRGGGLALWRLDPPGASPAPGGGER